MLNWALKYQRMGWSVIPICPKGKEPLISWKVFQQRIASEQEIQAWWKQWPDANVGVVTGLISKLAVIDLDGPEGMQSANQLNLTALARVAISITGKGKHLWYRHPGGIVANSVKSLPGVDIRGDGGFVLTPPSIHPNGKKYRWLKPVISVGTLPIFPAEVFASNVPKIVQDVKEADSRKSGNDPGWISQALEDMTDGNIDDTLFRICAELRNKGYTEADAFAFLNPHAERVGATEGHLQDKIDNVWGRYIPKQRIQLGSVQSGKLTLHSPANPDSLNEYNNRISREYSSDSLSTGYKAFDTLSKGLRKDEVLTVAARTGVGKTNWIITPIRSFCENGRRVLLFSTEMSFDQIWQRYKATLTKPKDFESHSFFICDEFTPNIERIEEAIKNVQPDLFVFDHISHIGTDYHIISKFMSEIKRLARLYGIPAIVTAQLNRHADYVEQGQKIEPRLSMIQGSDQIGQMSAQVLLLNEKRINGDIVEIEGIIVKNRHGDKGMIQFGLVKNPYRMVEI